MTARKIDLSVSDRAFNLDLEIDRAAQRLDALYAKRAKLPANEYGWIYCLCGRTHCSPNADRTPTTSRESYCPTCRDRARARIRDEVGS